MASKIAVCFSTPTKKMSCRPSSVKEDARLESKKAKLLVEILIMESWRVLRWERELKKPGSR